MDGDVYVVVVQINASVVLVLCSSGRIFPCIAAAATTTTDSWAFQSIGLHWYIVSLLYCFRIPSATNIRQVEQANLSMTHSTSFYKVAVHGTPTIRSDSNEMFRLPNISSIVCRRLATSLRADPIFSQIGSELIGSCRCTTALYVCMWIYIAQPLQPKQSRGA